MNDISKASRQQKASALLALGLLRDRKSNSVSDVAPSDEELAALLEGSLDTTRRAQIMESLAADPAAFSRWMALVEAADTLGIEAFAQQPVSMSQRAGVVVKLADFAKNQFRMLATAGTGLAAAASVFLIFSGEPGYRGGVDELYQGYGAGWSQMPAEQIRTRSTGGAFKRALQPDELALRQGVVAGAARLGPEFVLQGVAADITVSAASGEQLSADEQQLLQSLGEVAVLSHFKCTLDGESEFFAGTVKVLESMQPALEVSSSDLAHDVLALIERSGDEQTRVCRLSREMLARAGT